MGPRDRPEKDAMRSLFLARLPAWSSVFAAALVPQAARAQAAGPPPPPPSLEALAVVAVAGAMVVAVAALGVTLTVWVSARARERRDGARIRELQGALARLSGVLDHTPDGYFEWAAGSGLETCSPALATILGAPSVGTQSFRDLAGFFEGDDYSGLERASADLRAAGKPFDMAVRAASERVLHARGRAVPETGVAPIAYVVWFHDITRFQAEADALQDDVAVAHAQRERLQEVLDHAPFPAWRRRPDLSVGWVNQAYCDAVEADRAAVLDDGTELVPGANVQKSRALAAMARQARAAQTDQRRFAVAGERRTYEITEVPLAGGETAGIARDVTGREDAMNELRRHADAHADVMNRLPSAIVIFGPDKRLHFFNEAFCRLWSLDEDWLETRPSHGEILEALRDARRLPEQADFPAYKAAVLEQYAQVHEPHEDVEHLPDGRTLRVVTAPHPFGGLLFIYEDVSDRIELERSRNTLAAVQKATLDHLFEGVAVFGADGRLKLFNPGYGRIWKLDEAFLSAEPHVADIAERCRALLARPGADWQRVKERVVHRTLERETRMERMARPDGMVVEVASVPLPDGNTLYTYFDVSDGTRIGRALREQAAG